MYVLFGISAKINNNIINKIKQNINSMAQCSFYCYYAQKGCILKVLSFSNLILVSIIACITVRYVLILFLQV